MKNLNTHSVRKPHISYFNLWWSFVLVAVCMLLYPARTQAQTCTYSNLPVTNVEAYVNGVLTSTSIGTLLDAARQGARVKVCFTPPAGTSTYTLVSYTAIDDDFSPETADQQVVYDYQTVTTNGNRVCLEIDVPRCYFQVDFVKGCKIDNLGPAGTDNFYGIQGRLIADKTGGKEECVALEGCTLGYWKNHTDRWCSSYTTETRFGDVFVNAPSTVADLTLLEALNARGGGVYNLARQGVAALLNACLGSETVSNDEVESPYSVAAVIYIVNTAYLNNTAGTIAEELDIINNLGCPLGGTSATSELTGINALNAIEQSIGNELRAYPVPFNDKATIEFKVAVNENYVINLYDMKGSLVRVLKSGRAQTNELQRIEIDGNGLTEGLYITRMISNSETKTVKLIFRKE